MRTAVLLLFCCLPAFGQALPKQKIFVDCTCEDVVGSRYATSLRDAIAKSPRFELATSASTGTGKDIQYNWVLDIISIDDTSGNPGVSSAISIVLQINDVLLHHHIQTCGRDVVDSCASTTLASADKEIQKIINTLTKEK